MSSADVKYNELITNILENGSFDKAENIRAKYEDGSPATAKQLINLQLKFDSSKEVPILTTKRVPLKDPIKELFWIWQQMSNVVQDLRDVGCSVWDEWERKDGTIGKAYAWQLRNKFREVVIDDLLIEMALNGEFFSKEKVREQFTREQLEKLKGEKLQLNQVDYLSYSLKKNPYSRQYKTTLWCVEDLDDMALPPCVYETHWFMHNDKLCLTVNIRSNDMALGNPYNIYQYFILHKLIGQVTNLEVGELCFNMDIPHIYGRHLDIIQKQIKGEQHEQPTIWINPEIKSFYDFTIDDIKVENYVHNGNFKYEIAI